MAAKLSKFQGIFQPDEEAVIEVTSTLTPVVVPVLEEAPTPPIPPVAQHHVAEQGSDSRRRTGRPATGKKSDPNYRQVTAYVRKDLYRKVTDSLYDESRGLDTKRKEFSELVDELLEQWWQNRSRK